MNLTINKEEMKNEELYWKLDDEEELSDQEKREIYFSEIADEEDYEQWKDQF